MQTGNSANEKSTEHLQIDFSMVDIHIVSILALHVIGFRLTSWGMICQTGSWMTSDISQSPNVV